MQQLVTSETAIKVSSTLDKSVGKKYLTDGSPETCWTSQQGLPQWIQLVFPHHVIPKRISFIFQGGFVGSRCALQIPSTGGTGASSKKQTWTTVTSVYPEDVNRRQTFDLSYPDEFSGLNETGLDSLRIVFEESSDFYGRVTIYDLSLEGEAV